MDQRSRPVTWQTQGGNRLRQFAVVQWVMSGLKVVVAAHGWQTEQ